MEKRKSAKPRRGSATAKKESLVEVRPFRQTGGRNIAGLTDGDAEFESPNERLALELFPLCVDITSIESQPDPIDYTDSDEKLRRYKSDFLLRTSFTGEERLTVEIKPINFLCHEGDLDKYSHIGAAYRANAKPFAFLTDVQMRIEPRASAVHLLARYSTCSIDPEKLERATNGLKETATKISALCDGTGLTLLDVYTLIALKQLSIDWNEPLDREALVSLPDQPFEGLRLENILASTGFGAALAELAMGRRPADQRVLAAAARWRSPFAVPGPWAIAGGDAPGAPLRDLSGAEQVPRDARRLKRRALGRAPQAIATC